MYSFPGITKTHSPPVFLSPSGTGNLVKKNSGLSSGIGGGQNLSFKLEPAPPRKTKIIVTATENQSGSGSGQSSTILQTVNKLTVPTEPWEEHSLYVSFFKNKNRVSEDPHSAQDMAEANSDSQRVSSLHTSMGEGSDSSDDIKDSRRLQ